MIKKIKYFIFSLLFSTNVYAGVMDYDHYFEVDMQMELPNIREFLKKIMKDNVLYDKGYRSRFNMGNKFKKEFSKTIKFYGLSEGRIKKDYEDELLEMISWLPKEAYQYIGPMLHEVPGMSEKILNLPGIKETKNKFPERVADKMKDIKGIEHMSPALYFLLMPEVWGEVADEETIIEEEIPVKKKKPKIELPDFMKEKIGVPVVKPENKKTIVNKNSSPKLNLRTISPTLTSPLTTKDAEAFIGTLEEIIKWGDANNMVVYSQIIKGDYILNMWEAEQNTALHQNALKDIVSPCQRLVLKMRFAGVYDDFKWILAKHGYTPEEWAYTGDKTIKAYRAAIATPGLAYAVKFHRNGYYNSYIERLPQKWREEMYANEAAIIRMFAVLKEDVEAVRPIQKEINEKFLKTNGVLLGVPIFY